MIARVVAAALKAPFVVFTMALCVLIAGLGAVQRLDVDAYSNPLPPIVEVIAQPEGMSAEDVERFVTVPLERSLAGMTGLDHARSQSLFGLANVRCQFKRGVSLEAARQEVQNRITATPLPDGVRARLGAWNPLGEIFRYELRASTHGLSIRELETTQRAVVERQLLQVPGVAEAVSFGGETRQYHVDVDPFRLREYGVTLDQITSAIKASNRNISGQRLALGGQAYTIRGVGLVGDVHDIESIVVGANHGVPVRVHDVATVELGAAPRLGRAGRDDVSEIVEGIVVARSGSDQAATLRAIHARLAAIREQRLLPPGVEIVPLYDRTDLTSATMRTVLEDLGGGLLLVGIMLVLLLGNVRAALVTAINVPLALLAAFVAMVATGTPASLVSLGALDFGLLAASTVVMTEGAARVLGSPTEGTLRERIVGASDGATGPLLFSTLITLVVLVPLFVLGGVAGVLVKPAARLTAFALVAAALLAITLTPALISKVVPDARRREGVLMRLLHAGYAPLLRFADRRPWHALVVGALPVAFGLVLACVLGRELAPQREEGNLWIRATLPASISLEESGKLADRMRAIVRGCPEAPTPCNALTRAHPEIATVVSQLGRPEDGSDVGGFQDLELFVPLLPRDSWAKRGFTKRALTSQLARELSDAFPTVTFRFSQAIADNVEEGLSGTKAESAVEISGPNLIDDEQVGERVARTLRAVPGIEGATLVRSTGQPSVRIAPLREACAHYGLTTATVASVIEAALGGKAVTQVLEGDRRFDLRVRFRSEYRDSARAIQELMLFTPSGLAIPLQQVADVSIEDSPQTIQHDDGVRFVAVKLAVRGRDPERTLVAAQAAVAKSLDLDDDIHLAWRGPSSELRDATTRIGLVLPVVIMLVALLVLACVRSLRDTIIVVTSALVAGAGGVVGLCATGLNFSVIAALGFASIIALAIQDSLLLVSAFQRLREDGKAIDDAASEAASLRLRPMAMTMLTAIAGFLPLVLTPGLGAETQKPLALVVIGGALFIAVIGRLVQGPLLALAHHVHLPWRALRGDSLNGT